MTQGRVLVLSRTRLRIGGWMTTQVLHRGCLTEGYFGPPVMLPKVHAINNKNKDTCTKVGWSWLKFKVKPWKPSPAFTSTDASLSFAVIHSLSFKAICSVCNEAAAWASHQKSLLDVFDINAQSASSRETAITVGPAVIIILDPERHLLASESFGGKVKPVIFLFSFFFSFLAVYWNQLWSPQYVLKSIFRQKI